jgi:hypothetical protein
MIRANIAYAERHVSSAFNRSRLGLIEPGIHAGFELAPAGGMQIAITHGEWPYSAAVSEAPPYAISIYADGGEIVQIPGPGAWRVVVDAVYVEAAPTQVALLAVATGAAAPWARYVTLGTVTVPAEATSLTPAMISTDGRVEVNPAGRIAGLLAALTRQTTDLIDARDRLTRLERWAVTQGYDPSHLYGAAP